MQAHVLLVEDDAKIARLTRDYLEQHGLSVTRVADGDSAVREALRPDVDVVVLDLMLPGRDGFEVCREIRAQSHVPIVIITARVELADRVLGLELGADDYVTKPFSARELLARIKAVMRRRAPQLADDVVEIAGLRIDPAAHQVSAGDKPIDLWTTELRLLHFFMTHPGRVFSRARLLDEVWGEHVFVEERTVDVHIRRLRQALAPTGHDKLIETVRGTGYRFKPDLTTANLAA
jgi:two-component system phosphate regulon response regulator PhoB